MDTGIRTIPRIVVLDRELRCQTGEGLRAWGEAHGASYDALVAVLEGRRPDPGGLLAALATTLGVSAASLGEPVRTSVPPREATG